jgi:arylsulfatase A-like enzyme
MPTLCDFGGVPPPPGLDGASLMPALTGAAAEPSRPVKVETYTYWEGKPWSSDSNRMVRRGKWKLSYYGHSRTFELFNLEQDPGEVRNLAAAPECAAVVAELSPLLFDDGWSADTGAMLRAKLDAMGWAANVRGFHDAVARDPLPIDATDLWPAMPAVRTWLEDPRLDKLPAYLLIVGEKQSLSGANT